MDEISLIKIIEDEIGKNYLGDDCAYISQNNITVTQDSLCEDIHFKREWFTPYQLGYKSVIVNISDVLASGANPKYLTIALSLPNGFENGWNLAKNISGETFVREFYRGAKDASCGAVIIGGDITGAKESIYISITAIGETIGRNVSSRSYAQPGHVIITRGNHGTSSAGLAELMKKGNNIELIKAHLEPELEIDFANNIAKNLREKYAMMDTSDGLADALFKIAEASNVKIAAYYEKIPHLNCVTTEQVLFGGEDYKLVASVPLEFALSMHNISIIGEVSPYDGIRLTVSGKDYIDYSDLKVFNHFKTT